MPARLQTQFLFVSSAGYGPIAAGATVSVPHALQSEAGTPIRPNVILPDRATPVQVAAVSQSTVTFHNPTTYAQQVRWFVWFEENDPTLLWQGLVGSSNVINPLDFGATFDGVTDDTAALQAAINAAGVSGGVIAMPVGTAVYTSTLSFPIDALGLNIDGVGAGATRLLWKGPGNIPSVLADRTRHCGLRRLMIECDPAFTMLEPVRITQGLVGVQKSTMFTLEDVECEGNGVMVWGPCIRLASLADETKNDFHCFYRTVVRAYTESGCVIEGRNALAISFVDAKFLGAGTGKRGIDTRYFPDPTDPTTFLPQHGGSFSWKGDGILSSHSEADIEIADRNDPAVIDGLHSENSVRFLRVLDYSAVEPAQFEVYSMIVNGLKWITGDGVAAEDIIEWYASGSLRLEGAEIGRKAGSQPANELRVRFQPKNGHGRLSIENSTILTGEKGGLFPALQPVSAKTSERFRFGTNFYESILPIRDNGSGLLQPWNAEQHDDLNLVRPTYKWSCQESAAPGTLFDQMGEDGRKRNLTPNGAPDYREIVGSWDRYWVRLHGVADERFQIGVATETDPTTNSVALRARFRLNAKPGAGTEGYLGVLGDATNGVNHGPFIRFLPSGFLQIGVNGVVTPGVYDYLDGLEHVVTFLYDNTPAATRCLAYVDAEPDIVVAYGAAGNTSNKGFGGPSVATLSMDGWLTDLAWYVGPSVAQLTRNEIVQLQLA